MSILLLLAACGTLPETPDDTGDTADTPGSVPTSAECLALEPVRFGACYASDALTPDSAGDYHTDVDATVLSVGRGPIPEACGWGFGNARVEPGDEGLVVTLVDSDGAAWTLGLDVPGLSDTFVAAGDTVSLWGAYHPTSAWTPDTRGFALYDAGGAILVAVEDAGWIDDLPLPDLEVAAGPGSCSVVESCGEYFRRDLDVTVGGTRGTVPFGEETDIGGLRVLHGGYDDFDGDTECMDWIPNDIALAVVAPEGNGHPSR